MIDITHQELCQRFKNRPLKYLSNKKFNWKKIKFEKIWLEDNNHIFYELTKSLTLEIDYSFKKLACYFHFKNKIYRMDNFTKEDLEIWICDPEEMLKIFFLEINNNNVNI